MEKIIEAHYKTGDRLPLPEQTKIKLLEKINHIYNEIGMQSGTRLSYSVSMNGDIFPEVIIVSMKPEQADLSLLNFFAKNGDMLPSELCGKSQDAYKQYIDEHEREVFIKLESEADSDYDCYK